MPENRFVGETARSYERDSAAMFDADVIRPTIRRLVELADGGPALELAIGTGRIALPLAASGVEVSGIELSADMVHELRANRAATPSR